MLEPTFTQDGLLPQGDYSLTFAELRESLLVQGPADDSVPGWDRAWRQELTVRAETLARQLWEIGITDIFLNGSFAEGKAHPNDIDGYFLCDVFELASGQLQQRLNALDPHKVWTWDPAARRPFRGYVKKQLPMWHVYRVELYPHYDQLSGIQDKHGNDLMFPAAFRRQRSTDLPKGIVQIVR